MKWFKFALIFTVILGFVVPSYSQEQRTASQYYNDAQASYNDKKYQQALTQINEAIRLFPSQSKPDAFLKLKRKIEEAIEKQRRKAEQEAAAANAAEKRRLYMEHLATAERYLNEKSYSEAELSVRDAQIYVPDGTEAQDMLARIQQAKLRDQVNQIVAEGRRLEGERRYIAANERYRYANSLIPSSVSTYTIDGLEVRIANYRNAAKEALNLYNQKRWQNAIDALDRADGIMALEKEEFDLRARAVYYARKATGDNLLTQGDFEAAARAFESAKSAAFNDSSREEADMLIKESYKRHNLKLAKAEFDRQQYNTAHDFIRKAKSYAYLNDAEKEFERSVLSRIEASVWEDARNSRKSSEVREYLAEYPTGIYAQQARALIAEYLENEGDAFLDAHMYREAITSYQTAFNYTTSRDHLDRKIAKAQRWQKLNRKETSVQIDIPVGYRSTEVLFRDSRSYIYTLNNGVVENDNGTGHQSAFQQAYTTPVRVSVAREKTLQITGFRPLMLVVKGYASTINGNTLKSVRPLDYKVYRTTYEPTNVPIANVDTAKFLNQNAYRLSQIGVSVGVQPVRFLSVYLPFQYIRLRYQAGESCVNCGRTDVEAGKFGVGLGFRADLPLGSSVVFSPYWENWNGNFNSAKETRTLYGKDATGGAGIFSFNPFSSRTGAEVEFKLNVYTSLMFRYEATKIRGLFAASKTDPLAVRSFSQETFGAILRVNF